MRARAVAAIGALLLVARVATAQSPTPRECILALPDSASERVVVYITADTAHASVPLAQASVDLFTQDVAAEVRRLVSGDAGRVGALDSRFGLFNLGQHVAVVAHRDGRMQRVIKGPPSFDTWSDRDDARSVAQLLAAAVDSVHASGVEFMLPEEVDSLAFDLELVWPQLDERSRLKLLPVRIAIPVATMFLPRFQPPAPLSANRPPEYPWAARADNAEGTVVLEYTVRADGSPDVTTIRDVWPTGRPRLAGREKSWYDAFLKSATQAVAGFRLTPAAYGGCPVPTLVHQPFVFGLNR